MSKIIIGIVLFILVLEIKPIKEYIKKKLDERQ
jgi:hypothetical protein